MCLLRSLPPMYYTPRPVVSFMCREALKGYLDGQDTGVTTEAIAQFVDERDTSGISVASAPKVAQALDEVTVVDPACGSGAYLLGMMQELVELQTTLFNVGVDPKGLYDLKMHVIQRNLYGVDIDDFAVNIAMLRMWLSLAIDYEGDVPPPLPNLDFKVLCGDSLLGPDPGTGVEVQGTLGYDVERVGQLGRLKADFMRASLGPDKEHLRLEIQEAEESVRETLGAAGLKGNAVDWRLEFAEVFAQRRGFDIAIANPPYLFGEALNTRPEIYRYALARSQFDAYWLFHERSLGSLLSPRGIHCFINSDALLARDETRIVREYLLGHLATMLLSHVGMVFKAGVSAVVLVGQRGQPLADHYTVVEFSGEDFGVRQSIRLSKVYQDPKLRLVTRDDVDDLIGTSTVSDHCLISRGEELGKKNLARVTTGGVPSGSVGVVSGAGVSRFRPPAVTHLVRSDQVRKPIANYSSPKVLIVKTGQEFKAAVDYEASITLQSLYNLHSKGEMPVEVICAILNSSTVNVWLKYRVTDQKKLFPQITQQNVLEIPVPDFTHQEIIGLRDLVRKVQSANDQEFLDLVSQIDDIVATAYGQASSNTKEFNRE